MTYLGLNLTALGYSPPTLLKVELALLHAIKLVFED
jgi:hypothetical protein